jgi:Tol biopolymer transport system component
MSSPRVTTRRRFVRRSLVVLLALGALLVLAVPAGAVLSGRNGRIAFTSGRASGDALAQLYLRPVTGSSGGGTIEPAFTPVGGQSRHASWSPDRTKIVFANGTPGSPLTEEYDLFVKDFVTGTLTALDGPEVADGLSSDHPAWSPDGTRIAYEHQPADGSAERDIMVKTVGTSAPELPLTSGAPVEFKPAWSPDSQTIYYARTTALPNPNFDIVKKPAAGGTETPVLNASGADEYQPSISPDGSQICFTLQLPAGDTTKAEVYKAALPTPGFLTNISNDNSQGDINCTWSPDGTKIAYVNGTFSAGKLVMKNSDGTSLAPVALEDDPGSNDFDGNPDWAPDGSPDCPDSTVTTPPNTPITIKLECTDTGPQYERTDPNGFVANDGGPAHGTTSDHAPLANPSTVKYTPNTGFLGTDKIVFTSFDTFGFGTDKGTVTINVRAPASGGGGATTPPKCAGRTATIVGTARSETLLGTSGRDVIVGQGGNDRIRAGRGNDIVCGGSGRDRIGGGRGNDRIGGDSGNDRVNGEQGNDRVSGGAGNDSVSGGSGRDRLSGNSGRDRLNGGSSRDRCNGGAGRDRGSRCEIRSRIP